jgi:hypothetical protein
MNDSMTSSLVERKLEAEGLLSEDEEYEDVSGEENLIGGEEEERESRKVLLRFSANSFQLRSFGYISFYKYSDVLYLITYEDEERELFCDTDFCVVNLSQNSLTFLPIVSTSSSSSSSDTSYETVNSEYTFIIPNSDDLDAFYSLQQECQRITKRYLEIVLRLKDVYFSGFYSASPLSSSELWNTSSSVQTKRKELGRAPNNGNVHDGRSEERKEKVANDDDGEEGLIGNEGKVTITEELKILQKKTTLEILEFIEEGKDIHDCLSLAAAFPLLPLSSVSAVTVCRPTSTTSISTSSESGVARKATGSTPRVTKPSTPSKSSSTASSSSVSALSHTALNTVLSCFYCKSCVTTKKGHHSSALMSDLSPDEIFLHPYVPFSYEGKKHPILMCKNCLENWKSYREEAQFDNELILPGEINEEICALCSDSPEFLTLCSSCPRSYCSNCLETVLSSSEMDMFMNNEKKKEEDDDGTTNSNNTSATKLLKKKGKQKKNRKRKNPSGEGERMEEADAAEVDDDDEDHWKCMSCYNHISHEIPLGRQAWKVYKAPVATAISASAVKGKSLTLALPAPGVASSASSCKSPPPLKSNSTKNNNSKLRSTSSTPTSAVPSSSFVLPPPVAAKAITIPSSPMETESSPFLSASNDLSKTAKTSSVSTSSMRIGGSGLSSPVPMTSFPSTSSTFYFQQYSSYLSDLYEKITILCNYRPERTSSSSSTTAASKDASNVKPSIVTDDVCFLCKDGGNVIECDYHPSRPQMIPTAYRRCLKVYHQECLGFLVPSDIPIWCCPRHYCSCCGRNGGGNSEKMERNSGSLMEIEEERSLIVNEKYNKGHFMCVYCPVTICFSCPDKFVEKVSFFFVGSSSLDFLFHPFLSFLGVLFF